MIVAMCAVDDCPRTAHSRGWCHSHYNNWYRWGDPLATPPPKGTPSRHHPIFRRFWSKVDFATPDGCWEWKGSWSDGQGSYGEIAMFGKLVRAHRVAYELVYGAIPEGLVVRHRCDNPPCVRPEHLELGTPGDNTRDARDRGRLVLPLPQRGEEHCMAKLTEDDVREIRRVYNQGNVTKKALAIRFDVAPSTIGSILAGRRWRHV